MANTNQTTDSTPTDAQLLAAVRRAISNYVSGGGQRTVAIGGASFTYASLDDLLKLESHYLARVNAAAGNAHTAIGSRFFV